jgi:eukaryotic-like serine/threonine-protein kinase
MNLAKSRSRYHVSVNESIGPYQVLREIGRGGMGVVYLARDARLERDVAIKALPEELAQDPVRLERFEREARTMASLNHPNLAGIHGIEEQDGAKYLVLEFVEGETLADRLDRGPLPVDEAIELAVQIAAGIEAAHEAGVIHRDLKPANIIVTPDGQAKVLDFGLARTDEGDQSSTGGLDSPTMTLPQHSPTIAGAILGTAAYMSPEQARGRRVDKRSDIWAFGVVLYEMLVGASPFQGETATDSIGAVLHKDVDLSRLPTETPANVRCVLGRCLVRDKNLRYRDIGDVRVELLTPAMEDTPSSSGSTTPRWKWLAGTLAVVCLGLIGFALWALGRPSPQAAPVRLTFPITLLPGGEPAIGVGPNFALSPDGDRLVVAAKVESDAGLWVRDITSDTATLLQGTVGGYNPIFSPDGRWIAYFAENALWKIAASGGSPQRLADVQKASRGLAWLGMDRIVYAPDTSSPLYMVSAAGGAPSTITTLDPGVGTRPDSSHRWPAPTPDGLSLVFTAHQPGESYGDAAIAVVDLASGRETTLLDNAGSYPIVLPGGELLYTTGGTVFACRVDWSVPAVVGTPRPVLQGIIHISRNGGVQLAVAQNGTALYIRGSGQSENLTMPTWLDLETGERTLLLDEPTVALTPRISPDGTRVVWQSGYSDKPGPLVVYELERGVRTNIPLERVGSHPVWSPDGREIAFTMSTEDSAETVHTVRIDGEAPPRRLDSGNANGQFIFDWSRDGSIILTTDWSSDATWNLGSLRREGEEWTPRPVLATPAGEFQGRLSPDGEWIAYTSDISGGPQVFIRRFEGPPDRRQISVDGGSAPLWAPDGRSVYFRGWTSSDRTDRPNWLMRVELTEVNDRLEPSAPQALYDVQYANTSGLVTHHDLHPDGKRLLYLAPPDDTEEATGANQAYLLTGWLSEIKRAVAGEP